MLTEWTAKRGGQAQAETGGCSARHLGWGPCPGWWWGCREGEGPGQAGVRFAESLGKMGYVHRADSRG